MQESSPAWQIFWMRANHLYTSKLLRKCNPYYWRVLGCVIADTFQVHKPIFGKIFSDHYRLMIPLTVFYVFLWNHRQCDTNRMTKWRETVCNGYVYEGARESAGEHYRRVKRYAKCGIMVWHVWKWTQWLGLMTLWEPKVGIMSWKRHILDKPAGMVMEQTAGVRAQRWKILTVDLDLMDFISAYLRVMNSFDTALQLAFLSLLCTSSVMLKGINHK